MIKLYISILFLLISIPSFAVKKLEPVEYILCKHAKMVRTIHITTDDGKNCATTYTKAGVPRIVGTGVSLKGCIGFVENIRGNLEEANWKCRPVPKASIENHVDE